MFELNAAGKRVTRFTVGFRERDGGARVNVACRCEDVDDGETRADADLNILVMLSALV